MECVAYVRMQKYDNGDVRVQVVNDRWDYRHRKNIDNGPPVLPRHEKNYIHIYVDCWRGTPIAGEYFFIYIYMSVSGDVVRRCGDTDGHSTIDTRA